MGDMLKTIALALILFSISEYGCAAPRQLKHEEKRTYAFPRKVAAAAVKEEDPSEITTFSDSDDFEESGDLTLIAQNKPREQPSEGMKKKHKVHGKYFRMSVAPQYSYMILRSHGKKKQRGSLGGITGEVEYKKREHVYANASFLWDQGDIHADGHRSNNWKEAVATGVVGYTVAISDHLSTTPYAGFGYRKVMQQHGFLDRITLDYYQYFVPFGFLTDFCFGPRFTLSLNLKAMPAVDSRVYLTNRTNIFWKLKNKGNYEVDLPFKWKAARTKHLDFDLSLVPFFKYWVLGPSPRLHMHSKTQTYWGVELQMGFSL